MGHNDDLRKSTDHVIDDSGDATEMLQIDRGKDVIENDHGLLGLLKFGNCDPDTEPKGVEVRFAVVRTGSDFLTPELSLLFD